MPLEFVAKKDPRGYVGLLSFATNCAVKRDKICLIYAALVCALAYA